MHGADGAAKSHARRGPSLCPAGEHGSSRICKGTTSHVTSSRIARRWSAGQDSSDSEEAGGTVVTVVVSRPHGVLTCRRQGHRLTGRVVVACSAGPRPPPPVVPSTLRRARRQAGRQAAHSTADSGARDSRGREQVYNSGSEHRFGLQGMVTACLVGSPIQLCFFFASF